MVISETSVNVRVPRTLKAKLQAEADRRCISPASLARMILARELEGCELPAVLPAPKGQGNLSEAIYASSV